MHWLSHEDACLLEYKAGIEQMTSVLAKLQSETGLPNETFVLVADDTTPPRHYSAEVRRRAMAVKRIHDIMGHPNDAALGILFDSGAIHGCPYTSRDLRIMRKLIGPCVACIKAKTGAPTDGKVINRWLASAPGERLCMDIYFMTVMSKRGKFTVIPMLIVVDDYTGYLDVVHLPSKTTEAVKRALFGIIAFYNHYDYAVKEIRCDRENVFLSIRPYLLDHPQKAIELDAMGADQHEKTAERAIQTMRGALRTAKAACWYRVPQFLYPYFSVDLAAFKNCVPNRKTVIQQISA